MTEKKPETKAVKFVRLAQQRVTKAVKSINQIGNLGGANYESTPIQIEEICIELAEAVKRCKQNLTSKTAPAKTGFTFKQPEKKKQ